MGMVNSISLFMTIPAIWPALGSLATVASIVAFYALGDGAGLLLGHKVYNCVSVKTSLAIYVTIGLIGSFLLYLVGKVSSDPSKEVIDSGTIIWLLGFARFF